MKHKNYDALGWIFLIAFLLAFLYWGYVKMTAPISPVVPVTPVTPVTPAASDCRTEGCDLQSWCKPITACYPGIECGGYSCVPCNPGCAIPFYTCVEGACVKKSSACAEGATC
jgi:hypothetical protein